MTVWIAVAASEENGGKAMAFIAPDEETDPVDALSYRWSEYNVALTLEQAIGLKTDLDKSILLALAGEVNTAN